MTISGRRCHPCRANGFSMENAITWASASRGYSYPRLRWSTEPSQANGPPEQQSHPLAAAPENWHS